MKLKQIIVASLALFALASCSKDEQGPAGGIEVPKTPVDASLSFMALPDNVTSRAVIEEPETAGDTDIRKLAVYIFSSPTVGTPDAEKRLAGSAIAFPEGNSKTVTEVKHVRIKIVPGEDGITSNEYFEAVFVANANLLSVATLAELKAKNLGLTVENVSRDGLLPMVNKKTLRFNGLKVLKSGDKFNENWVDNANSVKYATADTDAALKKPDDYIQPVEMERLVARVQVESVAVAFDGGENGKYGKNAQFTLKHLSLVNVPNGTTIGGTLPTSMNDPWVKGYQSGAYEVSDQWIAPNSKVVDSLHKEYEIVLDNDLDTDKGDKIEFKDGNNGKLRQYVFTNPIGSSYQTALLISGLFTRDKTKDPVGTLRHYRVYLAKENDVYVARNTIYKLIITLDGEGSGNEDHIETTAGVQVKIESGPWKTITQDEEIDNKP